jgi:YidC/Oxa1 family membrane protein insertase
MGQEKRLLVALALCVMAVLAIDLLVPKAPRKGKQPAVPAKTAQVEPPAKGAVPAKPADPVAPSEGGPFRVPEPAATPDQPVVFGRLHTVVRSRGASLGYTWLQGIPAHPGSDASTPDGAMAFLVDPPAGRPGALALSLVGPPGLLDDLDTRNWEAVSKPGEFPIVFRSRALAEEREQGKGIVVEKRFHPPEGPGDFHLRLEIRIWNDEPDLVGHKLDLRVRGAAAVHAAEGPRDVLYGRVKLRNTDAPEETNGGAAKKGIEKREPVAVSGDIEWVGTASTYFAAVLDPDGPPGEGPRPSLSVRWEGVDPPEDPSKPAAARLPQPSPLLFVPIGVPKPGETRTAWFTFYVGPTANAIQAGEAREPMLDRPEYEGFKPVRGRKMFHFIEQGLYWILRGFHALVPVWGICIVLLTVLVRGLLFPLSRRQLKSTIEYSRKMQKVKPLIDALKEKYGDNRQKITQEQMRLMKEHGVPLMPGGCLLTFLQLPIWIALYGMLQSNYDLRHAAFLWIDDLSQADHLLRILPGVKGIPLVPNSFEWLNLLPLVMTATWFFASKATMTPPADEQQAQMQSMMQWMPFVMLLFPGFYDMPAGLCLYITASSTWGIVESRIIRKSLEPKAPAAPAAAPTG